MFWKSHQNKKKHLTTDKKDISTGNHIRTKRCIQKSHQIKKEINLGNHIRTKKTHAKIKLDKKGNKL